MRMDPSEATIDETWNEVIQSLQLYYKTYSTVLGIVDMHEFQDMELQ